MFKRDNEQPVKVSFEEKNEKRTRRSLRERLSNIPLRRRVEAVLLAVVTIMASLSIDWSSLSARAAEKTATVGSGWSITQIYSNSAATDEQVTTLKSAKLSVKKPDEGTNLSYSWKVYQNFAEDNKPEDGALVASGDSKDIAFSDDSFECEAQLDSKVILLGREKAAVVFTLNSSKADGTITYKTTNGNSGKHYVKESTGAAWAENGTGTCIEYEPGNSGTLTPVTPVVPENLVLKAGDTYTFSDIKLDPAYKRNIKLTEEKDDSNLISVLEDSTAPTFTVKDEVGDGGEAKVKLSGNGVNEKTVTVKVVGFGMKGEVEDPSVFTYKGSEYTADNLFTAKCGSATSLNDNTDFEVTFTESGKKATPLNAGSYTLKFSGKGNYSGLEYTKEFTIAPKKLEETWFTKADISVSDGEIQDVDGAVADDEDFKADLIYGVDFDAAIKETTPTTGAIKYTITIQGKGNFKGTIEKSGIVDSSDLMELDSIVGHIEFPNAEGEREGVYNGQKHYPKVKFYDKNGNDISTAFSDGEEGNYKIVYTRIKDGSGDTVDETSSDSIVDAGTYTATVEGKGIYRNSSMSTDPSVPYVLKPVSFDGTTTKVTLEQSYFESDDTLEIIPKVASVTYNGKTLEAGVDYEMEGGPYRTAVNTYLVKVFGRGNYSGYVEAAYTVFPSLSTAVFALNGDSNGTMKKAEGTYVWTYNGSIPYTGNAIDPGIITAKINGKTLSVSAGDMTAKKGPNVKNVTTGEDKAYYLVTLPPEYASTTIKVEFEIVPNELSSGALKFTKGSITKDYAYGTPITLTNSTEYYVYEDGKRLKEGDYDISYENNVNAGTATITATGKGNYTGSASNTFTIDPIDIGNLDVSIGLQVLDPSGTTVIKEKSDVVITVDGVGESLFTSDDFDLVDYKNNNRGAWMSEADGKGLQPQVTVKGKNNLSGQKTVGFQIKKNSLKGLTWELSGTNKKGVLGEPGSTIDISAETDYYPEYAPLLSSKTINLYENGRALDDKNYVHPGIIPHTGINTIKVSGKGDYDDEEYTFTFEVKKLNLDSDRCQITKITDGSVDTLPTFSVTYDGRTLEEGNDYEVKYSVETDGSYEPGDGYYATFIGKDPYEGTKRVEFSVGKPFDKKHVFITMYGPTGTKTVNGENRLTYFGDNDPYFILTSDKTGSSEGIEDPTYDRGAHDPDTGNYNITFEPSDPDEMHKVGTTVKVTFTAKEGNGVWYNPGNEGITYFYKVMPGVGASVTGYPNLQKRLSIFTDYTNATPQEGAKKDFPETVTNNLIQFSGFEFPYTTEGIDPKIYIRYDPKIESGACATECSSGGVPSAPTDENIYAEPKKVKFNDSSLFTVSKGLISANDTDKKIIMTPVRTGWLGASQNPPKIEVDYTFTAAKLSDATITFTPSNAEYTYTGAEAALDYKVTIGAGSTLLTEGKDKDYTINGYYKIPDSGTEKTAIEAAIKDKTTIGDELSSFGDKLTSPPKDCGNYALVIEGVTGGNYQGYNIAQFSIKNAGFTAVLSDSAKPVIYGDTKIKPEANDLIVTGVNGEKLLEKTAGSAEDGYVIDSVNSSDIYPRTDAVVNIIGTGNYKGSSQQVIYRIVADISENAEKKFNTTNLGLSDAYKEEDNCLPLTLENDGVYPYVIDNGTKKDFNLSTLTLSYVENSKEVKLPSSYLRTTVTGVESESSLTTVGKKKIVVEAASGAPVTGKRTYYVKVLGDISTASATFEAGGKSITGTEIPYTDSNIDVETVLTFRGKIIDTNNYSGGSESQKGVGKYPMTLTGKQDKYYTGQKKVEFSIVYDLGGNIKVYYQTVNTPLAGHSFPFTGQSYGDTIGNDIIVKIGDKTLDQGQNKDYTLLFSNDKDPGTNTASVTIKHASTSINEKVIKFSIGGVALTDENCVIELDNAYSYEYDGNVKTPTVSVSYKEENGSLRPLEEGTDFRVTYSNNINATNDAKAIVNGINGRYTTTNPLEKTFAITPKPLTAEDVDFPDVPFGGRKSPTELYPSTSTITVTSGGTTLREGTDYDISYGTGSDTTIDPKAYFTKNPTETYTITITGKGNYGGTVVDTAKQLAGTLDSASIVVDQSMTSVYNGKRVTFGETGPVIKNGNVVLVYGEDYTLDPIPEIINAGEYGITIRADKGDYKSENGSSSKTFTYTVTPRSVEDNAGAFVTTLYDPVTGSSDPASFTWTGSKIEPKVRLVDTGISGHDASVGDTWTNNDSLSVTTMMDSFAVSYGTNTDAGAEAGTVTLTASGNYTGTITKTFAIGQDISYASLTYDKTTAEYDGTPKSQTITVKYNGQTLTEGTAYESPVVYNWVGGSTSAPTEVGTYIPVIKGKHDGGYYGEKQGTAFRIIAQNKTGNIKIKFNGVGGEVDAADYVCHYNTKKQTPSISVYDTSGGTDVALTENVDYTVSYGNNTNAGSGYVYVALKGNYTGTAQEIFTIQPYDISNATLEFTEGENGIIKNAPEASFPYSPLFRLRGTDDNGEQFVISYADSRQKQDLSIPDSSKVKKPGKGSLAVSGTGNNLYGTTNVYDYEVYGRLSEKNVIATPPINTGVKKDPEVKVVFAGETLVLDTDYSLRIVPFDQTVSGGGNVIVEGLGYFTGSVYTKYGEASDVSSLTLRGFSQQYIYSGVFAGPQESAIYAVDKDGNTVISADKLECTFTSDKDNAACITANATVTITTKATLEDGTVQDGPKATYKIVPRNINSCDIMRLENDIYTGKALKPPVAVSFRRKEYTFGSTGGIAEEKVLDVITLKEGTDYSLSYKNNVYPGTADITVTGKGNYTGTRLFHFVINVISMGSVNAKRTSDGIVVSWGARPYVAGYRVLYDTEKLTAVSTTGTTVTLKDALPTRVGVQPYILGSGKTPIYGAAKYIDVS